MKIEYRKISCHGCCGSTSLKRLDCFKEFFDEILNCMRIGRKIYFKGLCDLYTYVIRVSLYLFFLFKLSYASVGLASQIETRLLGIFINGRTKCLHF